MRYFWHEENIGVAEVAIARFDRKVCFRAHETLGIFTATDWIVRMLRNQHSGQLRAGEFGSLVDLGQFIQGVINHQVCATNSPDGEITVDPAGLESSSERIEYEDPPHDIC